MTAAGVVEAPKRPDYPDWRDKSARHPFGSPKVDIAKLGITRPTWAREGGFVS
jgi:hypothetical protein